MENKNINRRKFLLSTGLMGTGLLAFPSSANGQEKDSSTGIYRNLETRTEMEKQMEKLQRKNLLDSKGLAIQDLSNKRKVRGFVYIPTVWGEQLKPHYFKSMWWDIEDYYLINYPVRAPIGLVEAIKKYTYINANLDSHLYLSSNKLIQYPFLYIATNKAFELTKTERENLENYLKNGGFALLESLKPELDYNQAEVSLKQMTRDVLKKDARFLSISNSHPLYHCFFDFNDGPPQGIEINMARIKSWSGSAGPGWNDFTFPKPRPYLEGIFLDDRLAVVYSGKGYGQKWNDISNNAPQQKMAVNFVVYALTQKGGITERIRNLISGR